MRTFTMQRAVDITGTGTVAEGVEFSTGWVALTWLTEVNSLIVWQKEA